MTADMNPTMTTENPDDTLCHHGIIGQRKGRRLYQNLDGSLTPLGRLRYGIGFKNIGQVEAARRAKAKAEKEKEENERIEREESRQREVEKVTRSGDANAIYALRESMTDQELTRAVNRMNATRQLESALKSVENKKIPDSVKPQKLSIFEQAKAKKEAKAQKEAAEKAEKERKAKEALDKGLQVLDTATTVANSLSGAYVAYNKTASMINEIGGDKLPQQLPTFNVAPWGKPNSGQTKKDTGTTDSKTETPAKTEKSNVSKKETRSSSSDDAYKSLMSALDSSYGNLMGDSGSSVGSSKPSSMSKAESDKAYKECMRMLDSYGSTKVPDDPYDMLMDMMRHSEDNDNVLCHYGRMGQKWGIRRYQNLDGSLTEAGRLRYSKTRDRYGMDIEDRSKLTKRQQKMQSDAGVAYLKLKKEHPELKTDNDIRKYAENYYKRVATIERVRTIVATALAAAGGTVLSGGNPIWGAASAGATFVTNTASQELTRSRITADYANTIAIGKEVTDKFMKDTSIYLVTLPEGANNNDTIKAVNATIKTIDAAKKYRK